MNKAKNTNYKPYPKYKDSGLLWLRKVPSHWEIRKLRTLLKPSNERNQPSLPLLSVVREKGVIKRDITSKEENRNYIPDDLSNYKVVHSGQFAMNKMKAWQGSYGISNYDGIVSPAYFVFDLNFVMPEFFHRAIRSKAYVPFFGQASDGVRIGQWDLSQTRMKEIPFAIPSFEEQTIIAKFIDYKTAHISRFVRAKRRMIELLKEQKQVIINQAVTKGVDSHVKLKPSGIDYLGDIPEHWEIRRLRTIAIVKPSGVDKNTVDGEIPTSLCNYVDVYKNDYITSELSFMKATASQAEIDTFQLKAGDVIITKDSEDWTDIAVPAYVMSDLEDVICAYHLAMIRTKKELILGEYLFRAFSSEMIANQFRVSANGITRYGLSQNAIKSAFFPVPPIKEQEKVIEYISERCKEANAAIIKANREIELIREYRTRLIFDVVTGKVDVRDIPVEPVEDIEEMEELEEIQESEELTELQEVTDADD